MKHYDIAFCEILLLVRYLILISFWFFGRAKLQGTHTIDRKVGLCMQH